jgi:hypothetical protein
MENRFSLDNNVVLRLAARLVEEIAEALGNAHKHLMDDETALRAAES